MFKHTFLASALAYSSLSFAGGPLVLGGPDGSTPVTYQNPAITLNIENGNLGTLTTNNEADALVSDALALWNNVSSSNINLIVDQTQINLDINLGNFESYLPNAGGTVFNADDNLNPIVYDSNGEIIDAFFGVGQSANTIGFAASIMTVGNSYFDEGYAVINGKTFDPPLSNTTFKLLIAHEIGHLIGLDHAQVNINNQETDFGLPPLCGTRSQNAYPLMYPFVCRDEETLHQDDISAISALYPPADINNNFGILQGQFVNGAGNAVLGANIWAENTTTDDVVSIVSDYLTQGTGFYKLYLPAGSYTLHANSINTLFFGGSSVGPYSLTSNDASFTSPHPIAAVTFQGDSAGSDEVINITVNQTQTVNFAINGQTAAVSSGGGGGDSFSDLFGATSHITLLALLSLLTGLRSIQKKQAKN
jgi:hypothetical protein